MIKNLSRTLAALAFLVVLTGCLNGGGTANIAPIANAGVIQNITLGALVTLDGSASSDANGNALTYNWTLTSTPTGSAAVLANANSAAPTFTADKGGAYVATLIVNDGIIDSAAATVTITAATGNSTPVANAGAAQNVNTGATVTLDGSASSDTNGDTLTYNWTLTTAPTGSGATLSSVTTAAPAFTADKDGAYVATLIVNDGKVDSIAATVTLIAATANSAPVANAGTAQSVSTGATVILNGSTSSDANGNALTYQWTLVYKPNGSSAALNSTTTPSPTFTADVDGGYVFALIVNDGTVNSVPATVTVTAATANSAPVANAGTAQNVIAGTTVTLNGSASSDANGNALTYRWTLTSKPASSSAALSSTSSAAPSVATDLAGTYVATLIVNDGIVDSTAATVTITAATANSAPVANAGAAQNVIAGTTVTLNGSASSDANGETLTYKWTLIYKPSGSSAALNSTTAPSPTFTADADGGYVFALVVNDGKVDSAVANVTITAATGNVAPVANAGATQNVTTGATVTLNGSASSDANGDALTYQWSLVYKPSGSSAALNSATAPTPTFTPDVAGTYVATLVVNDGKVNSSAATAVVSAATYLHVTATSPLAGAGNVALRPTITATFDSALIAETVNTSTFTLSDGTNSIIGVVSYSGSTATFTVGGDLANGTTYTATLTTGILNSSGNVLPGNYTWTFTTLPRYAAVSGGCAYDSITNLSWEVKTTDGGLRDWNKTYTNYDDTTAAQFWGGSAYINPTQAQIDAPTNTVGYAIAVNATNLCGHSDWRLPTSTELQSLVITGANPAINSTWFPNTQPGLFWSSSPYVGLSPYAWNVNFSSGGVDYYDRFVSLYVRLVRAGQ